MRRLVIAAALAALAPAARAEVVEAAAAGFQVRHVVEIAAPPARVWEALIQPGRWWEPTHSWSGDPVANLTLDARPGGCFCETLPGGGAQHLTVVFVRPAQQLDLWGALGPLHTEGAAGGLSFRLAPSGAGSTLTVTYTVGGFAKGGLQSWAAPVDGVIGAQAARLERYVETGRP